MITENKVTDFFCIADDFCKVFDAQITALSFKKASHFQRYCYFSRELQVPFVPRFMISGGKDMVFTVLIRVPYILIFQRNMWH